jgi:hypothetical protein
MEKFTSYPRDIPTDDRAGIVGRGVLGRPATGGGKTANIDEK